MAGPNQQTGLRIFTFRHWSLVGGMLLPLLVGVTIDYVRLRHVLQSSEVSPWYPVLLSLGLGIPILLPIGTCLSYALPWPRRSAARFGLGVALGVALLLLATTRSIRF
jgi:hypothetical protein